MGPSPSQPPSNEATESTPPTEPSRNPILDLHLGLADEAGKAPDVAAAQRLLQDRLFEMLPPPPARLLVASLVPGNLVRRLTALGYRVEAFSALPEPGSGAPPPPVSPATRPVREGHPDTAGDLFDAILLVEALSPVAEPEPVLRALRQRLAPEGMLFVADVVSRRPAGGLMRSSLSSAELDVALAEVGLQARASFDWSADVMPSAAPLAAALAGVKDEAIAGLPQRLRRIDSGEAMYRFTVLQPDSHLVRAYREGDEGSILELFAQCFHQRRDEQHWRWQYRSCPNGTLRMSLAFSGEAALVAQYAGYPVRFLDATAGRPRALSAHQIGDTMTLPAARSVGRGPTSLLARTASHFYARFCEGQIAFNYGFNVGNIQAFSMRFLRAQRVEAVTLWQRPALGLRRAGLWQRLGRRQEVSSVAQFSEAWDRFLDEVAPAHGVLLARNSRYLQWRYLDRPGLDYGVVAGYHRGRLKGWSVFLRRDNVLVWGDALFHPEHLGLIEGVLAEALAGPLGEGAERIEAWFPTRPSWLAEALSGLGFTPGPQPQDLSLMCVPFSEPDATALLGSRAYYTLGDSDLF